MKRVGLPRALIHYKFSELWIPFFKELGAEVVISPLTTKKIKDLAVRAAPDEDCYSTKLYFGHVLVLKDKVDYLFIPRYGGYHKNKVGCPKFIGLAEVLKSMIPDLPPIIMPHFNRAKGGDPRRILLKRAFEVGLIFTKNPFKIFRAVKKAFKAFKKAGGEAQAYNNLGCIYLNRGLLEEAVSSFENAIKLEPGYYAKAGDNLKKAKVLSGRRK